MTDSRQALMASLGAAIQAYQRSTDALDDVAAHLLGVNRTDLRCLDWLSEGPMSAGQLTEATGLSSAATTTMLDRLERKGFVQRRRDATDRRKVVVEMTELGNKRAGEIYGPLRYAGVDLLAPYSDDELRMLGDVLDASREITDRHRARLTRTTVRERSGPAVTG